MNAGRVDDAVKKARDAAWSAEGELGPRTAEVARSLRTLGELLMEIDRPDDALDPLRRAVSIYTRDVRSAVDATETLDLLGTAYERCGRHWRAKRTFRREIEAREHAFGKEDPSIAEPLEHLAEILKGEGKLEEAETLLRRAIALLEPAACVHLEELGHDLHALGDIYLHEAKFEDARRTFERAVRLIAAMRGPESQPMALPLRDLGAAYARSGDLEAAATFIRRSLALCDRYALPEYFEVRRQLAEVEASIACREADARN